MARLVGAVLMNSPLVSVGITTYNRPEGLRRTLECITGQTYRNLEIIVGDNSESITESLKIVQEFARKDPRIKYWWHGENKGGYYNAMFVLNQSHGEYFMWASDDDEWNLNYIDVLLCKHMQGDYVLTASCSKVVGNDGKELETRPIPNEFNQSRYKAMKFMLSSHHWAYGKQNMVYGLFWKEVLHTIKVPLVEAHMSIGGDIIFLLRVLARGNIGYIPEKLMTKHLSYPAKMGGVNPLAPLRYFLRDPLHVEIDKFTGLVNDVIGESGFGPEQRLWLKVLNQINRLRMVMLF